MSPDPKNPPPEFEKIFDEFMKPYVDSGALKKEPPGNEFLYSGSAEKIRHIKSEYDRVRRKYDKITQFYFGIYFEYMKEVKRRKRKDLPDPEKSAGAEINRNKKQFGVDVSGLLVNQFDEEANKRGITRQDLFEQAVETALKSHAEGRPLPIDKPQRLGVRLSADMIESADKAADESGASRRLWVEAIMRDMIEP